MSFIAGLSFLSFKGALEQPADTSREITRNGADGTGLKLDGRRGRVVSVETISVAADAAAAKTVRDAILAKKSVIDSVTDAHGIADSNVTVRDVAVVQIKKVRAASDGSTNYLVYATWQLQIRN